MTPGRAVCLGPHDLAASKLVAFRGKDLSSVRALLAEGLLDADQLVKRIQALPIDETNKGGLLDWLAERR
jgi:hypothetical protein